MKFDITYYKIYPNKKILDYKIVNAIDQTHALQLFCVWVKNEFKAFVEILIVKDLG